MRLLSLLLLAAPLGAQTFDMPERLKAEPTAAERRVREARTLFAVGVLEVREERYLQAVNTLESALLLDPESSSLHRELAPVYLKLGRPADARAACRKAVEKDGDDYETRFTLAKLLEAEGETKEALAQMRAALTSPNLAARPERRYLTQLSVTALCERLGDLVAATASQREVIAVFDKYREQFLDNGVFTEERIHATRAEAYERLGKLHQERKQYPEALEAYRTAREQFLKLSDERERFRAIRLSWHLCDLAFHRGQFPESLAHLDDYLRYEPMETAPYERKAELFRKLGRGDDVLPMLEAALAKQSHHNGLKAVLAREYGRTPGRVADAEKLFDELLDRNPQLETARERLAMYLEQGKPDAFLAYHDRVLKVAVPREDAYSPAAANAARTNSAILQALERCDKESQRKITARAVALCPSRTDLHPALWHTQGLLAMRAGDHAAAKLLLETGRERSAGIPMVKPVFDAALLDFYPKARLWDEQVHHAEAVLANKPNPTAEALLRMSIAQAHAQTGRIDEGLKAIEPAIETVPFDYRSRVQCMKIDLLARGKKLDEAKSLCDQLLKGVLLNEDILAYRITYSRVLQDRNEHDKAEEQLRAALELSPADPLVLNNLGYMLADRGVKLEEAEKLIRKALEEDQKRGVERQATGRPIENGHYLDSLGWVLFRQGKAKEAREYLLRAVAMDDARTAELWDHLGDVNASLGLKDEARKAYEQAKQMYEQDWLSKRDGKPAAVAGKLAK